MAGQFAHKFYCRYCDIFIWADMVKELAERVNRHNEHQHPLDFAGWTEKTISDSANYKGSATAPPPYLKSPETAIVTLPALTDEDRRILQKAHIKW